MLDKTLLWSQRIANTVKKHQITFTSLYKRNLSDCLAYLTMVHPQIKSAAWDPYYNINSDELREGLLDGYLMIIEELAQYH